ncbi:retrovirus-related Pol polyprotein from transposon opus [Trichonephila clavipes]|nr:retrovirus-related Pol polyprotein from transposon opus [Trichonephila clavipes]
MTTCIPGIAQQQFQVKKTRPSSYGVYHHLPSWAMNEQMSYFSSFSDEWSRDLKTTKEIPVVFKYRNSVHVEAVKVPNKSDGWDYFFSSLEKAFASEMVSDELKPKVLLCMLGDKVSNLLVNLGEEELKDYESLKQVVLKEYEPSPQKICLENFRKAKRSSDETFSQFASRLTSMWLYYCKLRGANEERDFESVNQLIVADKMFEMLDSETATHIGVLQGKNGTELEDGTVTARVDLLGKVIPRGAIEDKLSKLVKTSISVDGKLVHALVDSGTEITVIKKNLVLESRLKELPRFI